jgi:predicted dehydrogenase
MRRLRVAVVGLGYWGPNVARVIMDLDDVELAWLCDLDTERLSRLGRRCQGGAAVSLASRSLGGAV